LYVVPIALSALCFGRRGGAAAAGCGIAAFVVLEFVRAPGGDVDVTGWVGPLLAMALMGGLVGQLSESAARHEAARRIQQRHLDELRRARRAALEVGDSIVQRVAAVRSMLEAGKSEDTLAALDATVAEGIAEVSSALPPLLLRRRATAIRWGHRARVLLGILAGKQAPRAGRGVVELGFGWWLGVALASGHGRVRVAAAGAFGR
ncbi:MAG: hypothetical protein M0Z42_14670, partial [Actinomycetota bacterium]|nr:hypothetical protein [Actinomycetota bacterium]